MNAHINRRRFLYLSGMAALAAGCGSSSSGYGNSTPGPIPTGSFEFGRGARRSTPEQIENAIQALAPVLVTKGGGFKVSYATTVPTSAQLPAAIVPPVQNQGPLESCGSFGISVVLALLLGLTDWDKSSGCASGWVRTCP